jgi:hypothetical protein
MGGVMCRNCTGDATAGVTSGRRLVG